MCVVPLCVVWYDNLCYAVVLLCVTLTTVWCAEMVSGVIVSGVVRCCGVIVCDEYCVASAVRTYGTCTFRG